MFREGAALAEPLAWAEASIDIEHLHSFASDLLHSFASDLLQVPHALPRRLRRHCIQPELQPQV